MYYNLGGCAMSISSYELCSNATADNCLPLISEKYDPRHSVIVVWWEKVKLL